MLDQHFDFYNGSIIGFPYIIPNVLQMFLKISAAYWVPKSGGPLLLLGDLIYLLATALN